MQHAELSKGQIRLPKPFHRSQFHVAHADDLHGIFLRGLFQHDALEIIAVWNLCPVHQNVVPILHAGLDAGRAHGVRQQSSQTLAGILSGFVCIQTKEHPLHVRTF